MKGRPNISYITANELCMGCGVCFDPCPKDAISFSVIKGLNTPTVNEDKCINDKGCSICYDVCPGKGLDLNKIGRELFINETTNNDNYIGMYQDCYVGSSADIEIRYHSASGGMITQMLLYLLKKKIINGAVVTAFQSAEPMKPYSYIATTKEEILNAKSTKYCPVSLNGMAREIKKLEGKYLVVGLPCHIQGFRNLEDRDQRLKAKIYGYFSIFCSGNQSFDSQKYLSKKLMFDINNLKNFAYRDDGCMGYLKAEHKDGSIIKVGYRNYYSGLRSFFKPIRCFTCVDHYGKLADVSFGDLQVGEYRKDHIGVNSVIVRNPEFNKLLINAMNEKYINIEKIAPDIINKSQMVMLKHKRNLFRSFLFINNLRGRKNPTYDNNNDNLSEVSLKGLMKVFLAFMQRFIGRRERFWFVIDKFAKNRNIDESPSHN